MSTTCWRYLCYPTSINDQFACYPYQSLRLIRLALMSPDSANISLPIAVTIEKDDLPCHQQGKLHDSFNLVFLRMNLATMYKLKHKCLDLPGHY